MKVAKSSPAVSLALVVAAAGVVTASPEFALDEAGEFTAVRIPDVLLSPGDQSAGRQ